MRGDEVEVELERSQGRDSTAGRDAGAFFNAFYDFAFPRVYGFAERHTNSEAEAEAFCRLVLVRALASLGGLGALEDRVHRVPAASDPSEPDLLDCVASAVTGVEAGEAPSQQTDLAFWLFCIARKAAHEITARPELLAEALAKTSLAAADRLSLGGVGRKVGSSAGKSASAGKTADTQRVIRSAS